MMHEPCYFEIHADDCGRAKDFYGGLFGWRFTPFPSDVEYYRIATGGAMAGGLLKRPGAVQPMQAPNAFVVTLSVESVDSMLEKAVVAGAAVALPKFVIPGIGWTAYLIDTEKNIFAIFQRDAHAA
jgi:predicted enzyme related to lactoylglutathione lyase